MTMLLLTFAGFGIVDALAAEKTKAGKQQELAELAQRMMAIYLDTEASAAGEAVDTDAMASTILAQVLAARTQVERARVNEKIADIDTVVWGPEAASGAYNPEKPPAALVLASFIAQWAAKQYLPIVREATGDEKFSARKSYLMDFPFDVPALHFDYRLPYDRGTKKPGTWNRSPVKINMSVVSDQITDLRKSFYELVCADVAGDNPFKGGGGSKTHVNQKGEWRSLPYCQRDIIYATAVSRDPDIYVAQWYSAHSILLPKFNVILQYIANGPLIANPEQEMFALKNMPAQPGAAGSAQNGARDLLAALEAKGAQDVAGYLGGDGVPPVVGLSEESLAARANQVAKAGLDWAKTRDVTLDKHRSLLKDAPYGAKVAIYIMMEEGTTILLRSGYEIALYNEIKRKLAMAGKQALNVKYSDLFIMALELARPVHDDIKISDVYLTILNVVRFLARPEQWIPDIPGDSPDITRDEVALKIIRDIQGHQSTDSGPTLLEIVEDRVPEGTIRRYQAGHPKENDVIDLTYTVRLLFGEEYGMFQYQPNVRNAHWNAGCHYYFWTGALGHYFGDDVAMEIGYWREKSAKDAGGEHDRAIIQLSHFRAGARVDELLSKASYVERLKDSPE